MKMFRDGVFTLLTLLMAPNFALSQQAAQPIYKNGDWWKVKTEFEAKVSSRNEGCQDSYKEWIVRIDGQGLANLFGVNDGQEVAATCDGVLGWVFGVNRSKALKFPLSVGHTWTHRYERGGGRRTIWVEPQYKVAAWEKIQTPMGAFEAFKIVGTANWVTPRGDQLFNNWTEWYSPAVKAIVLSESETAATKRKVMLVDFNVAQ